MEDERAINCQQFSYLMSGSANNGWKDSSGSVITGKTGLAHS